MTIKVVVNLRLIFIEKDFSALRSDVFDHFIWALMRCLYVAYERQFSLPKTFTTSRPTINVVCVEVCNYRSNFHVCFACVKAFRTKFSCFCDRRKRCVVVVPEINRLLLYMLLPIATIVPLSTSMCCWHNYVCLRFVAFSPDVGGNVRVLRLDEDRLSVDHL